MPEADDDCWLNCQCCFSEIAPVSFYFVNWTTRIIILSPANSCLYQCSPATIQCCCFTLKLRSISELNCSIYSWYRTDSWLTADVVTGFDAYGCTSWLPGKASSNECSEACSPRPSLCTVRFASKELSRWHSWLSTDGSQPERIYIGPIGSSPAIYKSKTEPFHWWRIFQNVAPVSFKFDPRIFFWCKSPRCHLLHKKDACQLVSKT